MQKHPYERAKNQAAGINSKKTKIGPEIRVPPWTGAPRLWLTVYAIYDSNP